IRVRNALRQTIMVEQVDKQHTAMVANTIAPAGQTNDLVNVALPERAAGVVPVTMHGYSRNKCRRVESGTRGLPEEAVGLPDAFGRGNRGRTETAPSSNAAESQKCTGPTGSARQADCLITTYAYLDGMTVHFP